jgi:hypothetical protein
MEGGEGIEHYSYSIHPSEVKCLRSSLLIDSLSSLGIEGGLCIKDNRIILE